jgi:hypothetical protein
MKEINGYGGIRVTCHKEDGSDNVDSAVVELDSDARELLDFVRELRNSSAIWNGYNFGNAFQDMLEDIASIQTVLAKDEYYRQNNPAVREAWEHYQTMLVLAKQEDDDDET